jgi:hypothetical protein
MGVSLEGTLETVALPDVLALLSVTSKTGELRVDSPRLAGSLWIDAGRIAGFEVGNSRTVADALFSLLRLDEGSFSFRAEGNPPASTSPPEDVAPLLEEAEARLAEWPAIAAVVPSLGRQVCLSEAVGSPVTLLPVQWQLVAAIGGGKEAGEVLDALQLGEFDGSKALKELVELGVVQVATPVDPSAVEEPVPAADTGPEHALDVAAFAPEFPEEWPEPADQAEPELEAEPEAVPEPEPVNRGLLLKFLGSARN